jgi:hypothetical protein
VRVVMSMCLLAKLGNKVVLGFDKYCCSCVKFVFCPQQKSSMPADDVILVIIAVRKVVAWQRWHHHQPI